MTAPVESDADVLAVWPKEYQNRPVAPVRDAIVAAESAMIQQAQRDGAYAADQADIAYATSRYLDGLGEDRGFARSGSETDSAYRARVLAVPSLVTPEAILDAVNAVLAPYTAILAQYLESIQDRAYLRRGSQSGSCVFLGGSPNYPSRLYPEDAAVNGAARRQCSPGGMWLFSDHVGRYFVLRVPDLSKLDDNRPVLYSKTTAQGAPGRLFLGNGSAPSPSYLYNSDATALDVYGAVASKVDELVGHSVRWKMISDPNLK